MTIHERAQAQHDARRWSESKRPLDCYTEDELDRYYLRGRRMTAIADTARARAAWWIDGAAYATRAALAASRDNDPRLRGEWIENAVDDLSKARDLRAT